MSLRTAVRSIGGEACAAARAASPASAKGGQAGRSQTCADLIRGAAAFINFHRRRFLVSMALTNAQNQARRCEGNIEKRRRAQRIANRLVRKIETVKHVEEIAERWPRSSTARGIRTLRRRLKELSESEDMAAHNEAFWKEQGRQRKELWLRDTPPALARTITS